MRRLLVSLAERSYDILIGPGLLAEAGRRLREAGVGGAVVVIADAHVAATYGAAVAEALGVPLLTLPAGEANKTLQQLERLYGELAGLGLDRQATLVAVGGGVTGDLVGFAAATFLRGINFVQVPTTLLAQVDASLGGKTAVDLPAGKNLVGAFHQPRLVLADLETLGTLPEDEYRSGLAEVVKYGVIADLDFLAWLEARRTELLARDLSTLEEMVARSCEIKAAVVGADERDRGRRAILNYGHTVGHAVEAAAGYGTYRHGEAVAIGMAAAGAISVAVNGWASVEAARVLEVLRGLQLPTKLRTPLDCAALLAAARRDKKAVGGALRMVLVQRLGEVDVREVSAAAFQQGLEAISP